MAHTYSQGILSFHSKQTGQHEASHHSRDEELYNLERKVERLCRHLRL